jgi:hypothetical protein
MTARPKPARDPAAKPTRRIRYQVACSLDGYITSVAGGTDWIVHEPEIDFAEIFARFDTLLMGRKTYEPMVGQSGGGFFGKEVVVVSRTLTGSRSASGSSATGRGRTSGCSAAGSSSGACSSWGSSTPSSRRSSPSSWAAARHSSPARRSSGTLP